MQRTRFALAALAILAMFAVVLAARPSPGEPTRHDAPAVAIPTRPERPADVDLAAAETTLVRYVYAVNLDTLARYDDAARQAEADEAARVAAEAEAARQRSMVRAPVSTPAPSGGVSGACGGATNGADQFIPRESGGDPNAYNPSGAWGCYQIMPGTWAGAGCNDLGTHGSASPAAQAACASRLDLSAWNL